MTKKPTYEELEQRVDELEKEAHERKRLDERLRLLSLTIEQSSEGIAVIDLNGNIEYLNDAFASMHGYSPEELVGKHISIFHTPDQMPFVEAANRRIKETGSYKGEIWHVRRDGTVFPTLMHNSLLRDEAGSPIGIIGTLRDMTALKLAEEETKASEVRFRELFKNMSSGVAIYEGKDNGNDFIFKDFNWTAERIEKIKKEDLIDKSVLDVFPGVKEFGLFDVFKRVWESGKPENHPISFYKDERIMGWRENYVYKLPSGEIVAVYDDITDRKRAEEALRESEEKYRSMMEAMKDPVSICSPDFRIEYMNSAMIKRTGRDATGERCFNALHDLNEKCSWCQHHKTQTGDHFTTDIVSPKDNRSYLVSHSPIFHEDGSVSKMTIFRDTTDFKKMEALIQRTQKMESIGTLAGGIAHDFNNILSPIMIHSEMAIMELPSGSLLQQNMKQIYKAGDRARDLVKQILTFARRQEKDRILLRVSQILKEAIKLLRSTIPTTIDIQYHINSKQDTVLSDPTQMNQIIMNLCTNAAHAMEENGGTLEVILTNENLDFESANEFPGLDPGHYVKLSVRDTGYGISPQFMDKIFDPYFTTKEVGKGTGMGLALVHGIVKNYGGAVTVQSEVGKGTSFQVYLPLVEEDTDVLETAKDSVQLPTGTEWILFVDDEKAAVDAIKPMLENLGYKVIARTSSIECLEAFRNKPDAFDLVITDQTMPKMTGKDLAEELMVIRPDIPIILCTGFSEQIDKEKAEEMGISAFVMKPIVMSDMAKTIREVLDRK